MVRRGDPKGRNLGVVQKVFGPRGAASGQSCRCRPETMDTKEHRKMLTRSLTQEEMVRDSNARGWKGEGERKEPPGKSARD